MYDLTIVDRNTREILLFEEDLQHDQVLGFISRHLPRSAPINGDTTEVVIIPHEPFVAVRWIKARTDRLTKIHKTRGEMTKCGLLVPKEHTEMGEVEPTCRVCNL